MANKRDKIKKDFFDFAEKVEKLEFLSKELELLNMKGFEKEVNSIRSKLKDVNKISEIEMDLGSLRQKIKSHLIKKDPLVKEVKSVEEILKKDLMSKQEKMYLHEIPELDNKFAELLRNFQSYSKIKLSQNEIDNIKDISKLKSRLSNVLEEIKINRFSNQDNASLELSAISEIVPKIKSRISLLSGDLKSIKEDNPNLPLIQGRLIDLSNKIGIADEDLEFLKKLLFKIKSNIGSFSDQSKVLSKIPRIDSQIKSISDNFSPLKSDLNYLRNKLGSELKEELAIVEGNINSFSSKLNSFSGEIFESIYNEFGFVESKLDKLSEDLDSFKNEERNYFSEIPKIEDHLSDISKQIAEHLKFRNINIDESVNILMDSRFDDFIFQIKADFSNKLKEKEASMDAQMRADFMIREEFFSKKYASLVKEFNDRYREKLDNDLKRDLSERFDTLLNFKLKEKEDELIKNNLIVLEKEKSLLFKKFEEEYHDKEVALRHQFDLLLASEKKSFIEEVKRVQKIFSEEQPFLNSDSKSDNLKPKKSKHSSVNIPDQKLDNDSLLVVKDSPFVSEEEALRMRLKTFDPNKSL